MQSSHSFLISVKLARSTVPLCWWQYDSVTSSFRVEGSFRDIIRYISQANKIWSQKIFVICLFVSCVVILQPISIISMYIAYLSWHLFCFLKGEFRTLYTNEICHVDQLSGFSIKFHIVSITFNYQKVSVLDSKNQQTVATKIVYFR